MKPTHLDERRKSTLIHSSELPGLFPYTGGKTRLRSWLHEFLPKRMDTYAEAYVGSGGFFFGLEEGVATMEAINDLDHEIYNVFKVLQDPVQFDILQRKLRLTPYSREFFSDAVNIHKSPVDFTSVASMQEHAWATMVGFAMSISGSGAKNAGNWGVSRVATTQCVGRWNKRLFLLDRFHERLSGVHIDNSDAIHFIHQWDSPTTVFYADPPYLRSTRKGRDRIYSTEMTPERMDELLDTLFAAQGAVLLSHYSEPSFDQLFLDRGWQLFTKDWFTTASTQMQKRDERTARTECAYLSPTLQKMLRNS